MNKWPAWIPNPNAWMSAILLILLARGLAVVIRIIFQMGGSLMEVSPKLKILLYFAALLSPILVVTLTHHWLHVFLDRFYPNTVSPEIGRTQGLLPSLMSWWEGLYGWMALSLAFLVSNFILAMLFSPSFKSLYGMLEWWDELRDLFTVYTLVRVITAAYIYQFEHLVRHHLMSVGSATSSSQQ